MSNASLLHAGRAGAFALALAVALGYGSIAPRPIAAAPLVCAGTPVAADASSAPSDAAATPTSPAAIPTQSAIEPEVNPPGDIPDDQAFVVYVSADGGYAISMPEGWARTETGPNVRFADKLHTFTVEVGCAASAPTVDSVTTTVAPALGLQIPAFELVEVTAVDLPAGPAILVRYRVNSTPDDVTGKQIRLDVERYELFQDGTLAVISLSAPAGSDNVDVSNLVSRSFRWTA